MTVKELAETLLNTCNHDAIVLIEREPGIEQSLEDSNIYQEHDEDNGLTTVTLSVFLRS